jgi:hypothetical protein
MQSFGTWSRLAKDRYVTPEMIESDLLAKQREFKRYKLNVFALNHCALKIQHWFFRRQFALKLAILKRQ